MTNREYIESFNDEAFLKFMSWFGNGEKYICPNYAGRDTDYKKIVNWYSEKYDENSDFWQFIQPTIDKVSNWNKRNMNNEWIPVSERLPEKEGRYFATIKLTKNNIRVLNILKFDPKGSWGNGVYKQKEDGSYDYEYTDFEVLAWMELPKCYEVPNRDINVIFEVSDDITDERFLHALQFRLKEHANKIKIKSINNKELTNKGVY